MRPSEITAIVNMKSPSFHICLFMFSDLTCLPTRSPAKVSLCARHLAAPIGGSGPLACFRNHNHSYSHEPTNNRVCTYEKDIIQ